MTWKLRTYPTCTHIYYAQIPKRSWNGKYGTKNTNIGKNFHNFHNFWPFRGIWAQLTCLHIEEQIQSFHLVSHRSISTLIKNLLHESAKSQMTPNLAWPWQFWKLQQVTQSHSFCAIWDPGNHNLLYLKKKPLIDQPHPAL